jgi:class 3 adenylate cyclase
VVGQLTSASQVSTFGEVTNLAARLQASAEAGEVLLTDEAYRRTRDWLDEKEQSVRQESLVLKGYSAPITAFRLALPAKTKV